LDTSNARACAPQIRPHRSASLKRIVIALAVLVTVVLAPAEASAQESGERKLLLMIQTVPEVSGVRFALNGKRFVSDSDGLAVTAVPRAGRYRLEVLSTRIKGKRHELTFSLWGDGARQSARDIEIRSFRYIRVGFNERRLHFLSVVAGHGAESRLQSVTSVTFTSARGVTRKTGPGPYWLLARRPVNNAGRLALQRVSYRIDELTVDGTPVRLKRGSLKPAVHDHTAITLDEVPEEANAGGVSAIRDVAMTVGPWVVAAALLIGGALLLRLLFRPSRARMGGVSFYQRMRRRRLWDAGRAPSEKRAVPTKDGVRTAVITVILVAMAAAISTLAALSSESKAGWVLPLVIVAGIGLGLLALTRFVAFVEVLLVARASLDITKLSSAGVDSAGSDAGARAQDPASLIGVLFLVAATFWLLAQRRRHGISGSPLRRALVFFMAAGILSVLGTASYGESLLEVLRILAAVVMFVVLEQLMADPKRMERLLRAVFLSALLPLALTTTGFLAGNPRTELKGNFSRLLGTFNQSNAFARYLMLILIFGVAVYPYVRRPYKGGLFLLLPLATVYLVLTYTLSAVIATVLGLVVVAMYQSKRLLAGLVVAGVCIFLLFPSLGARFAELGTEAEAASFRPVNSTLEWRLSHWAELFPLAKENPVTGIGLGTTSASTESEAAPHNDFLRAYVETGIIGFVAYVSMLVCLIATGRRALRRAPLGSLDRGVAVGFMGCAVAYIAVSLVANVMSNVVILWYFFAFAAAASSVVRRRSGRHGTVPRRREQRDPGDMISSAATARG
jgi:putative inorganic carbon (hco3(-)) transporter